MDINNEIHFSPSILSSDLERICDDELLAGYKDRLMEWYISAAELLNSTGHGFGAGVILLTLIDCLAKVFVDENSLVGTRFKQFVEFHMNLPRPLANILYDNFRNGLVHEGRIKGNFSFSYRIGSICCKYGSTTAINPEILCKSLKSVTEELFAQITPDKRTEIIARIKIEFGIKSPIGQR